MEVIQLHLDILQLVVVVVDLLVVQTLLLVDLEVVGQEKQLALLVVLEPLDKEIMVETKLTLVAEAVEVDARPLPLASLAEVAIFLVFLPFFPIVMAVVGRSADRLGLWIVGVRWQNYFEI